MYFIECCKDLQRHYKESLEMIIKYFIMKYIVYYDKCDVYPW